MKSKKDLLFLCDPCRTCIMNPFECSRNGVVEKCKYLKNWNELVEYIDRLDDNQLTYEEAEFIVDLLKPLENELETDITLLIDKIRSISKEHKEEFVTSVDFD